MATNTTNYGWTKPDYEDDADIAVLNETFDAIDEQVKTNENNISNVQTSLAVGSSDDGKVLTASYSGGTGSYAWVTPSGGDVTGVKGSGETNYRTGNVSLSAANVGAIPTTEKGANGGVAALDSNGKIAADKIAAGALANGMTATTQETSDDSTKLATTAFVHDVVDSLPSPMVYKGTLGTGGTITTLPVDGTAEVGDTYKVITAGTYASQAAKIGDMFICLTKATSSNTWSYVPSGDDIDVTQVSAGTGLTTASGSPITTTGTIKAKLKSSTALAEAATNSTTTGKSYAVNVDSAGDLACNVPWTDTTYTFNTAYNASTNKAATMSDITTSAENGTLTGYEKKTGNVAATDKIVEAIGKLETKADTNKTNILLNKSALTDIINSGGKNSFDISTITYATSVTVSGTTMTMNDVDSKQYLNFMVQRYQNTTAGSTIASLNCQTNTIYAVEFTKDNTFNTLSMGHNGSQKDGKFRTDVSNLTDGVTYVIQFEVINCNKDYGNFSWKNIMITPKSLYQISDDYDDYCPTLAELYALVKSYHP